jgi:hypothetical protein
MAEVFVQLHDIPTTSSIITGRDEAAMLYG